jgi:acyl carrier protein
MNDRNYLLEFNEIIRRVFFDSRIKVELGSTAYDVDGWDSLSHVRLLMELEKHFGVDLTESDTTSTVNVDALLKLIKTQLKNEK